MEIQSIHFRKAPLKGTVILPGSKSISNRLLVLEFLSGQNLDLQNISSSEDTHKMKVLLAQIKERKSEDPLTLNCDNAGTVIRFLAGILPFEDGIWILDGNDRMRHRPIAPLVESLRRFGVEISYLDKEDSPPIRIIGKKEYRKKAGVCWEVDASMSSQFVSALMMASCLFPQGVHLRMQGETKVSLPYIQMTASLLRACGVQVEFIDGSNLFVDGQIGRPLQTFVESDWTSVSYFYGLLAINPQGGELQIPYLYQDSWQGDCVLLNWFETWGIQSVFDKKGLMIRREKGLVKPSKVELDFTHHPDLMPTMAVVCAATQTEAVFTGLQTLKYKETDRLEAVITELQRMKVVMERVSDNCLHIFPSKWEITEEVETYADHRMAMSFSMMGMLSSVRIKAPQVVKKSFDGYWDALRALGNNL